MIHCPQKPLKLLFFTILTSFSTIEPKSLPVVGLTSFADRGAGFIMNPAVQMDPPYFAIKEAINQIQNNMVLSQSQTERKTKIENENI